MPIFQMSSNLSHSDIPAPFHKDLTTMLGQLLQKNPNHNSVRISTDQFLTCGGTTEACAFDNFASTLNTVGKDNDAYVKAIPEIKHEKVRIDDSRFTSFLSDPPANEGGSLGLTLDSVRRRLQAAPAA
ncbi:macrophage migration inhibitory factor homolog [Paramacrobiotus metropolitanus]|uniref:macrophage migration inhibitory factor homolog n=1 Tax=Paramacrobiotus metropolitanus TaxID=2943436 RepID=UPI002445C912|nr:macrophage migration inhibitory factor homolog [Paramacrobiotus metropolitanus]